MFLKRKEKENDKIPIRVSNKKNLLSNNHKTA